jgi:ribose transport system ATP-binding protein
MVATNDVALRMRGIEKSFGNNRALAGVDLDVRRGEVHALLGENGAGKSTLMKVLSGAYTPDRGEMTLDGEPYAPADPLDARRRGVAMIYQELSLAPHLTVAENIVLGREPGRFGAVDRRAVAATVGRALEWIADADLSPGARVSDLAPGARQLVEVARAIASDARVVVMDEPTSSLSSREAARLFDVIERLSSGGVSVIYISHFLEEVRRVARRYSVLRDGRSVDTGDVPRADGDGEAFVRRAIEAMVGRSFDEAYPRVPHTAGEPAIEISELTGVRLPSGATLTIRRGEILGIAGLVGAGRTEFVRAVFGLDAVKSGRVRVGAVADAGAEPAERLRQGVGLLSEDRAGEGLALGLSIGDNAVLSKPPARGGVISRAERRRVVAKMAQDLSLRYRDPEQAVGELSGGNQQKVAIARLLHHDVDVLLLDEPTRGIDVATKADVYRLIGELAARGKAILFISSYLPELLGVCDRIAVMSRGRLGEPRAADDWTEVELLEAAVGGHA